MEQYFAAPQEHERDGRDKDDRIVHDVRYGDEIRREYTVQVEDETGAEVAAVPKCRTCSPADEASPEGKYRARLEELFRIGETDDAVSRSVTVRPPNGRYPPGS